MSFYKSTEGSLLRNRSGRRAVSYATVLPDCFLTVQRYAQHNALNFPCICIDPSCREGITNEGVPGPCPRSSSCEHTHTHTHTHTYTDTRGYKVYRHNHKNKEPRINKVYMQAHTCCGTHTHTRTHTRGVQKHRQHVNTHLLLYTPTRVANLSMFMWAHVRSY